MRGRNWLFLPFGAAFGSRKAKVYGQRSDANPSIADGGIDGVPRHETAADYAHKKEEDAVVDYNAPIHWWVVSTLFPLIAGTFGPMASAFNICAIAIDWRRYVSPTSTEAEGTHIPDPQWLVAVNSVSLAIAILANLFLLGHMSGHIRFAISAPCTIIGWYISGLLDIALAAAAPTYLPLPENGAATWSQAYYYGCFAGALYVLMSILLTFTACGVWVFHFSSEFKLTSSQRSLMLQTIMYLGYLLAAAEVYSYIEGWEFLDAVYYVNVTLFTIGFGDFSPHTHLGRCLLFPMAVGGILFVGLIIANIRTLVLESGSLKISTRMVEKARYRALKSGDPANGTLKLRGLKTRRIGATNELERREQEFQVMRDVLAQAAHDNWLVTLTVSASSFFVLWLVGAVVFWQTEAKALGGQDWSYFDALYFTYVSLLTIGYGDFYPQTNSGKPAFVFWSMIALPTLTVLIGSIGDAIGDIASEMIAWIKTSMYDLVTTLKYRRRAASEGDQEKHSPSPRGNTSYEDIAHAEALRLPREHPHLSPEDAKELHSRRAADAAGYAYRPYIIMKEIRNVIEHLNASPPRKYSFSEWMWLLRLLNEDEADPSGHRVPGHQGHHHLEAVAPVRVPGRQAWSWMGQESPLMSTDSEATWILKRLMETLEVELRDRGDKHVISEIGDKGAL